MKTQIKKTIFFNKIIDKSQLKNLIIWSFRHYGIARAANMADKLKDLGFYYATQAGISLSLEDLRIPPNKDLLLQNTITNIIDTDTLYKRGDITAVERFQKVIDTWNSASETLKEEVVKYFKKTDPLNSIYMMAFSGARANISQVRQLVGMRGLMADPQGQIIDLPISSNFREGLTVTDYFISSYGARKGLVDTALRTADSGYLTRRLVDVAQDVIIREYDCKTSKGILLEEMVDNQKVLISFSQTILGRVLAEDIINPITNSILAYAGQSIDPLIIDTITKLNISKILVRSPLTCESVRSVCQLCYGWNLAHGKIVDVGEAVGIIAAQSIGEPGTQLTMRTFHTGGVFTGETTQNIVSPENGIVEYPSNLVLTKNRTKHGQNAWLINANTQLIIKKADNDLCNLDIMKGSLLVVSNNAFIQKGQIIAECPISNRSITERAQKLLVADFSGSVLINNNETNFVSSTSSEVSGVSRTVWILSGQVYNLPNNVNLFLEEEQIITKNSVIGYTEVKSYNHGRIQIIKNQDNNCHNKVLLLTSLKLFNNIGVFLDYYQDCQQYFLQINNKDKFLLKANLNEKIIDNQVIADLISNVYKTKTGGIIKYLDLNLAKFKDELKDYYEITGSGYILWISEETHEINKDLSLLLVEHGQFVEAGTEIIPNVFANNAGVLEILHKDGIIREIIIKPGKIYSLNTINLSAKKWTNKSRGFLRPGESLCDEIVTDKLVYWESMLFDNKSFVLIRPVIVYSVPNKNILFSYSNDSFNTDLVDLCLVKRTKFKDGERVKSIAGVDLLTTHLIVKLSQNNNINCSIQLEPSLNNDKLYYLKFLTADLLLVKDVNLMRSSDFFTKTSILVKDGQTIQADSTIAKTQIFSSIDGKVDSIQRSKNSNHRMLIIRDDDTTIISVRNNQIINVAMNDWVYNGDIIATDISSPCSGKIISITDNQIIIRLGQPYLISPGSLVHLENQSLVQKGENIATLIYDRLKTGDIVQGLPRIEEILEARKKLDNSFNPHFILEMKFRLYLMQGLSVYDATRLSFLEIQLFLVKEVQLVYQSQGVDIADKHIEVIVRQMTSKVKIDNGGDTDYLPGEIIEFQKIVSVNQSLSLMNKNQACYHPILLGITKASLNTESFISAASFQETTKVLTEAAISGKLDWLRGLKENVIIGRLIPAGTGFNVYNSSLLSNNDISHLFMSSSSQHEIQTNTINKPSFDDIIVDDRNYNHLA
uniref:DNA-directed RNA polymerase n=1 Tax=Crouania attenuata TaxID=42002 RepID=A0A4D6WQD0_9FLOR|nr:RNA polymerase b'-subunit [Crouania attenuata]